jgi:uncharacterized protein
MKKLALITGASSGIGRAYAEALATEGYNLILVARRISRLEILQADLQQHYDCSCEILSMDLSDPQNIELLANKISSLPALEVLINNAGFGSQGSFNNNDPAVDASMINLHVLATSRLCRAALPIMLHQKSGTIINISSVAALMLTPGHIQYDATKGYILLLSKTLAEAYRSAGIRIQALCPGYTRTEFHQRPDFQSFRSTAIPGFMWMNPETLVKKSLRALKSRRTVVIPGLMNQLLAWCFQQSWLRFFLIPFYRKVTSHS